jgi:hypothetical protein
MSFRHHPFDRTIRRGARRHCGWRAIEIGPCEGTVNAPFVNLPHPACLGQPLLLDEAQVVTSTAGILARGGG